MKTLTLKQLLTILAFYHGQSDFKKKLKASPRPMRRLYKLESNPDSIITDPSEVYEYAFEKKEGYSKNKLAILRMQLREALSDFVKLHMLDESAVGQNLLADFYEQHGHPEKANEANKEALHITKNEPEQKRWFAAFKAHESLHFRGKKGHLEKAQKNLLLFFLVSYLKLAIETLTFFRIDEKKNPIKVATPQQIKQVFELSQALKPPLIDIQVKAAEYYLCQDIEQYEAFKAIFLQKIDLVNSDKKHLLISLLNAIALYPNPNKKIIKEYLPIYKTAIEKELFANDDLEVRTVCNILIVADFQKDYGLTKLAKEKLIPLLADKKERIWCDLLADIYLQFGKKEFNEALNSIKKLDKKSCNIFDITYRKNILKLKCSYEISGHSPTAYNNVGEAKRNFEKLLKRNFDNKNLISLTRVCGTNFINFLMMVSNTHNKKYTKAYLLEKLARYKGKIMETKWLKEKIAERSF